MNAFTAEAQRTQRLAENFKHVSFSAALCVLCVSAVIL
jgi:hypothetical protein